MRFTHTRSGHSVVVLMRITRLGLFRDKSKYYVAKFGEGKDKDEQFKQR